jgi:hypothetical protein
MESSGALNLGDFMISFVPISKFGGGSPPSIKKISSCNHLFYSLETNILVDKMYKVSC